MPYIKAERRKELDHHHGLASPDTAGELNYEITKLLIAYCHEHGLSYQRINDCIGACYGAAQEFYRRVAAPYENEKIAENGDLDYYAEWAAREKK